MPFKVPSGPFEGHVGYRANGLVVGVDTKGEDRAWRLLFKEKNRNGQDIGRYNAMQGIGGDLRTWCSQHRF